MTPTTIWWVLAGLAVVAQLMTGTFHFLMLAAALAAGALAAMLGGTLILQLLAVAVVGAGAVVAWYFARKGRPTEPPAEANRDVIMDIGETVQVEAWNPDGTATTRYRGAQWTVFHRPGETPQPGPHRVAEVVGNRLLVDKV